ncbi:RidA family protein [Bosea sp. (in: a-proteobacteria)]|uniref:RidA family protein n=1 Tax=Bosea sp. (in: a-proteobacteria) TaxID=1871050 RepID=UPI002FC839CB
MPMKIDRIDPASLAPPTGYCHVAVVSAGRQVHVSGQIALDAMGKVVGEGDVAAQAEQVYANLAAGLAAAGADFSKVFKTVTYVVELTPEKVAAVRKVRAKYLGEGPYPASTMVGVTALVDPRLLIEIELVAALD